MIALSPVVQGSPAGYECIRGAGLIYLGSHHAVVCQPTNRAHPSWVVLGASPHESISPARRQVVETILRGPRPFAAGSIAGVIRECLDGRLPYVPPLQPTWQGVEEIWLGDPYEPIFKTVIPEFRIKPVTRVWARDCQRSRWPRRVREYWLDTLGYLPAVTYAAISILAVAGVISHESLALAVAALPVTDAFTGTDGTALDVYNALWVTLTSNNTMSITTNSLRPDAAGCCYRWTGDAFNSDHYSEATDVVVTGGAQIGLSVRCQSGSNSYYGYYANVNGSSKEMFRMDSGTKVSLGTGGSQTLNDVRRIFANGSTIQGNRNGSLDSAISGNPFTDTNYTGGAAGVCGNNSNANNRIDNWQADNLAAATVAPSTNDTATAAEDVTMKMHLSNAAVNDAPTVAEAQTMHMPIHLRMEKLS